jgi:hypothetical protein
MLDKIHLVLRWVTAGALGIALAIWLVVVAFALLGFRRTAGTFKETLLDVFPIVLVLLMLLALASAIRWVTYRSNTAR